MAKGSQKSSSNAIFITRSFDAPRELVWKAWSDPEMVMRWWGPKGFTAPVAKNDFHAGGKYLYVMRSPDGQDFWSTGIYREIDAPNRLVVTDSFADEKGNVVPASHYGMIGDWPLELLVTLTFEEENGMTRFSLRHEGIPPGQMSDLTKVGWNESFDKLETVLAEEKARM
jgi:uncharacterized protein YndB with AHSA1/START domain